jgi:hypothetical protein
VAVAAATPAAAAATRPEVDKVVAAYADLSYDEARRGADALLARDDNGPDDLAALYRVRGELAAAEGDKKAAAAALERLLALDPGATPGTGASPKIAAAYDAARARWKGYDAFAVTHAAPRDLDHGDLELTFLVKSDPLDLVKKIVVHYLVPGSPAWRTVEATGLDEIEVRVPASALRAKAVAYWAAAVNDRGSAWRTWGSPLAPIVVPPAAFVPALPAAGSAAAGAGAAGAAGAKGAGLKRTGAGAGAGGPGADGAGAAGGGKRGKTILLVAGTVGGVMVVSIIVAVLVAARPTHWELEFVAGTRE